MNPSTTLSKTRPSFVAGKRQQWLTILITTDGSTSFVITSPPPLKHGTQYSIAFVLTLVYHPQEHFVTWKLFNTMLTKRLITPKQDGIVTSLRRYTTCNLILKGHGKISKYWWEVKRVITLLLDSYIWDLSQGAYQRTTRRTFAYLQVTFKKCSITTNRPTKQSSTTLTYGKWWGRLRFPPCGKSSFVPSKSWPTKRPLDSMEFPQTPSSRCFRRTLDTTSVLLQSSGRTLLIYRNGTRAKLFHSRKVGTCLIPTNGGGST